MRQLIGFLIGNINIWSPILVIIIGFCSRKTWRTSGRPGVFRKMTTWFCFFSIGLISAVGALYHIAFGDFTAHAIGWQPSPFQYEVGVANLAFAVLGFYAFAFKHYYFRLAVCLGFSVWFLGDAAGHIYQYFVQHDTAAYNAGSTLYSDIYLPIMAWILVLGSRRKNLGISIDK